MLKVIFHENYLNYDFGPNHPWRPRRPLEFLEKLKKYKIKHEVLLPHPASDDDLLLVHSQAYLERLKKLAAQNGRLSLDTPLNERILQAAYFSVGGSILAANLALAGEKTINLLGGLHHAGINQSSGFCVFNDHAIAVRKLQKEKKIKKALIYDLDVHAGQGTQEIFYGDATVFTVSLHQDPQTLYPGTGFEHQKGKGVGEGYNQNICLPPGLGEEEYLKALDSVLPLAKKFLPQLVILVLGVDTFKGDPLANINLEIQSYEKIGQRFKQFPKLAVVCAGGYSPQIADLWISFLKGYL